MKEEIYSKESLESINSPNELNDYIRIARPRTWILVLIIFFTIIVFFMWANFVVLDVQIDTTVVSRKDILYIVVNNEDIAKIDVGKEVHVKDKKLTISAIGNYDKELNSYIVYLDGDLPVGVYDGKIILNSIQAYKLYLN